MTFPQQTPEDRLGKEYVEHHVFDELKTYAEFYSTLSFSIMSFITSGIKEMSNLDTYAYSSIGGTLDSIHDVLRKGKINDAYALLRKYYDSTIINSYSAAYLLDNFSSENFVVSKIDNWRNGTEQIPPYRTINNYIKQCERLVEINRLLYSDNRYKEIRERCNGHMHYNFYKYMLLNDNELHLPQRVRFLEIFSHDVKALFIQHFAYIFSLNDHYMSSSDYMDALEVGLTPDEGSENFVAPFVRKIFNELVRPARVDIANQISNNTRTNLD